MGYFIIITIILLIGFLASTIPYRQKHDLTWLKIITAHRGMYTQDQKIAENSMLAFKKACFAKQNIELDLRITKDHQVIVFHDKNTKRMCHEDFDVEECDYHQLKSLSLGSSTDKIPLLSEVLSLVQGEVGLVLEIKSTKKIAIIGQKVSVLLANYHGKVAICSFDPMILVWFKKNNPTLIRGQIIENSFKRSNHSRWLSALLVLNGFGLMTRPHYLSLHYPMVQYFRWMRWFKGFICTWAIDTELLKEKYQYQVDGLICAFINESL